MATLDYNIPHNIDNIISLRLASSYPELHQFEDEAEFIYAGLESQHTILKRTVENIIQQVIDAYDRGKRKIFFDIADEGIINLDFGVLTLHKVSSHIKTLYPNMVCTLIAGSANSKEEYINLCKKYELEPCMEILSCYFFESIAKSQLMHRGSYYNFQYSLLARKKIFTCLNRVLRYHRIQLLNKMLGKGLVNDKCYYSFYDSNIKDGNIDTIYNCPKSDVTNIVENFELVKTLRLNFDETRINPADLRNEDFHLFHDSYFSVVPETIFYTTQGIFDSPTKSVFFSEKTYKQIIMMQPFILAAVPNSLSVLRERGFKTFHPYIDETYDTIVDDNLRLDYIVNEVERLSKKTETEWLQWLKDVKPIVEHNLETLRAATSFIQNKDLISRLQSI